MDEELISKLSSMLSEKDINLNDILSNFQNTSSENTSNTNNKSNSDKNHNQTHSTGNYNNSQTNSNESYNNNQTDSNKSYNQNSFNKLDPETLIKLQKIMSLLNTKGSNSKDETLLLALKPYMRKSKKEKIDQYIKLLHIIDMFEKFQEMGGNINDFL